MTVLRDLSSAWVNSNKHVIDIFGGFASKSNFFVNHPGKFNFMKIYIYLLYKMKICCQIFSFALRI